MSKKTKHNLQISFIGGNSDNVTGSMILLEWNNRKCLLDCGIIQGGTMLQDYSANKHMLTKHKLKTVDTVIVGELHADHTCNIPYITKINPDCKIVTPIHHQAIFRHMWEDSAKIMERDCQVLARKYSDRQFYPTYDLDDVEYALTKIREYDVGQKYQIDDDIAIRFAYSGHIFACCQTELWINVDGQIKHLIYTADLGNTLNKDNRPFTEQLEQLQGSDIFIGESTYAAIAKHQCTSKTIKKDIEKLYTTIEQYCIDMKSRVLIPTFSLDRTPAMLYMVWKRFKDDERFANVKVLIDSPLANKLLDTYIQELDDDKAELLQQVLSWANVVRITEAEESKYAMEHYTNAVILSSSGMLNQGRSRLWFKQIVSEANCCCLLAGFCSPNTLGAKLKDNKQKTITIDDKVYKNRCNVVYISGQSSHMQRAQLLDYYSHINAQKIVLVHGNMEGKVEFAADLKQQLSHNNKTAKVCVCNKDTRILL